MTGGRLGWWLSGAATTIWLVAVLLTGTSERVAANWESALTMLFGSFLAGSSPEGGGAVAFPVFTKALQVPAPVARSFGLMIQAVGMTMASISILLNRRPVHRRAVLLGSLAAVAGFGLGAVGFGRNGEAFWPTAVPGPWVKATFSIVLATTSVLMIRHLHHRPDGLGQHRHGATEPSAVAGYGWTRRSDIGLMVIASAGGLLASMTGTGPNIVVFLFLVVLVGVGPKVALPSAILVMTAVSIAGFVIFGLVDGQLDVTLVGDRVVAVGGSPVAPAIAEGRSDLLGLWLAAVPVVVWGAPLGALAASLVREHHLVRFVALLAAVEVVTTFVLVPELRSDRVLILYSTIGLAVLPVAFILGERYRRQLFGASSLEGSHPAPVAVEPK